MARKKVAKDWNAFMLKSNLQMVQTSEAMLALLGEHLAHRSMEAQVKSHGMGMGQ